MVDIPGVNLDLSGMFTGAMRTGYIIGVAIAIFIVIAVLWYFIVRPMSYKIRVIIWAARGGTGIVEGTDKAKITKGGLFNKSPIAKLKFFKRKVSLPVPELNHFVRGEKGDSIYYYKYGESDYAPIVFSELTEKFKDLALNPSEEDVKLWWLSENKSLLMRNTAKDFLAKYGQYLMFGGLILCIIVVTWIISGVLKEYIGAAQNVGEQLKTITGNMAVAKAPAATTPPPGM